MSRGRAPVPHYLGIPLEDWCPASRKSFAEIYPADAVSALVRNDLDPHRARTQDNALTTLELFQGALRTSAPALLAAPLEQQINADTVRAFVERLLATNKPHSIVDHLGRLVSVCRRLDALRKPVDIDCVLFERAFIDVPTREKIVPGVTSRQLYDTGRKIMSQANRRSDCLPRSRRRRPAHMRRTGEMFRDGLLLCVVAVCPLRLANLAVMELDQHIRRSEDCWRISLRPDETKSRRVLVRRIPSQLWESLEQYVGRFRPLILDAERHKAMWPSRAGGRLTSQGIYAMMTHVTKRHIGKRVRPHDARRAAGNAEATAPGAAPEAVQIVLDHGDPHTAPIYVTVQSDAGSAILSALTGC